MNIVGMLRLILRESACETVSSMEMLLVSVAFIDQLASDNPFLIIGL